MNKSDFDLTNQNRNTSSKIVASLERIAQAFRVLLWQESKAHALTPIQVQMLIFLLHHSEEKRKVSYIAREFNMTKATVSDTVKTLVQKNLITKEFEPYDTRSYVIHLTNAGKDIAEKTSLFSGEIHAPVERLSQVDREILLKSLLDVIKHLNKAGIITIQRMCMTCIYYESSGKNRHFCKLLNQKLHVSELRIDCPDHVMIQE
jgi:DNA-binding MarR family transcriptional regulator